MKNSEIKRLLKENYPYPMMTIRADQRFNEICDRIKSFPQDAPMGQGQLSSMAGREIWEVVPVKRKSTGRTALKAVAALAVITVVSLIALNFWFPQTAESLPGIGSLFQQINQLFKRDLSGPEPEVSTFLAEDNGTRLLSVGQENQTLSFTLRVPYMGRASYSLLQYDNLQPFGIAAELTEEDGSRLQAVGITPTMGGEGIGPIGSLNKWGYFDDGPALSEDDFTITWNFEAPVRDKGKVVLTLYEQEGASLGLDEKQWVTAEFTIDLETGEALASSQYALDGREKLTPEEYRTRNRNGEFSNGWYTRGVSGPYPAAVLIPEQGSGEKGASPAPQIGRPTPCPSPAGSSGVSIDSLGEFVRIEFFGESTEEIPLRLNCYRDNGLFYSVDSCSSEELELTGKLYSDSYLFLNEKLSRWILTEEGGYSERITDPVRTGKPYRRVIFAMPASVLPASEDERIAQGIRMELEEVTELGYSRRQLIYDTDAWLKQEKQTAAENLKKALPAENTAFEGSQEPSPGPLPINITMPADGIEQNGVILRSAAYDGDYSLEIEALVDKKYTAEAFEKAGKYVKMELCLPGEAGGRAWYMGSSLESGELRYSFDTCGEKKVILRVVVKNNNDVAPLTPGELLAEFTLDLEAGDCWPSETYRGKEAEDDDLRWDADAISQKVWAFPYYRAADEKLQALKNGYCVEYLSSSPDLGADAGGWLLNIVTDQEYQDLEIRMSNGKSNLVGFTSPTLWGDGEEKTAFQPIEEYSLHQFRIEKPSSYPGLQEEWQSKQFYTGEDAHRELGDSGLSVQTVTMSMAGMRPTRLINLYAGPWVVQAYATENGRQKLVMQEEITVTLPVEETPIPEGYRLAHMCTDYNPYVLIPKE